MKKVGISDATRYFPPAHNDCSCFRLQGQEQTGTTQFSLGCTHFLPGGGADFSPSRPFDTIYFCIDGEITITDKDGNDSIAIRSVCHLSIGYDHRIIDGAVADQFMVVLKKYLENWSEPMV